MPICSVQILARKRINSSSVQKGVKMPKNKGKGGKNRRRGKNENEGAKRELILKEEGQVIFR